MKAGSKKIIWRILQTVLIGLIFYFLGRQILIHQEQVLSYDWQVNYYYLIGSTLSVIFTFFLMSSVWRFIIASLGKSVSFGKAFKIAYLANLGRYIPGKIWQMFGMIYLAKKEGISEEEAVTSFGLTQLFAVPSGLLAGILFLALSPGAIAEYAEIPYMTTGIALGAAIIFVLSLLVVFFPRPIESLLNRLLGLLKRPPVRLVINKSLAAAIYGGYFLAWSLYGFSFWLFLRGVTAQATPLFPIIGLFIIAYQIGYLFLFAPGGMGPREAVLTVMLTPFLGQGVAGAVAIASRLWLIIAEALSAAIALKIK